MRINLKTKNLVKGYLETMLNFGKVKKLNEEIEFLRKELNDSIKEKNDIIKSKDKDIERLEKRNDDLEIAINVLKTETDNKMKQKIQSKRDWRNKFYGEEEFNTNRNCS